MADVAGVMRSAALVAKIKKVDVLRFETRVLDGRATSGGAEVRDRAPDATLLDASAFLDPLVRRRAVSLRVRRW